MWLTGWGYVIDNFKEISRIVQLPGDIKSIEGKKREKGEFFNNLKEFIALQGPWDIIIGDFSSGEKFNAKDLIDEYGTYALLANWFPNIAREILGGLRLNKPRSEFINININTLRELLKFRKFAYEQTLNMLIHSYDIEKKNGNTKSFAINLGP